MRSESRQKYVNFQGILYSTHCFYLNNPATRPTHPASSTPFSKAHRSVLVAEVLVAQSIANIF